MKSAMGKCSLTNLEGYPAIGRPVTKPAACTNNEKQGSGRWLDALTIALGQAAGGKWYVSTLDLQLVSFEVCVACRGVRTLRVTVDKRMPLSLWGDDDSAGDSAISPQRRRLPSPRAAGVAWKLPAGMVVPLLSQAPLLREAEWMQLTGVDCSSLEFDASALRRWDGFLQSASQLVFSPISYLEGVQGILTKVKYFVSSTIQSCDGAGNPGIAVMQNISGASWPPALRQLSIGCLRKEHVDLETLPKCLERLHIGRYFDQPIEAVSWPVTLVHLTLGEWFNQPVGQAVWPAHLVQLAFGDRFDKEIAGVKWPASLQQLTFGKRFNQAIAEMAWPSSLQQLAFGKFFDKPINDVAWPPSLQRLTFGKSFNQPITEVAWPSSLQRLTFGDTFDQPITGVVWPASLEKLAFGETFDQPIVGVIWPCSLRQLHFKGRFDQAITDVAWPASLRRLKFGDGFDHPINEVVWPSYLQSLVFGRKFNQPLHGATWPASLRSLAFSERFLEAADVVELPVFAHSLRRGSFYEEGNGLDCPPGKTCFETPTTTFIEFL